MASVPAAPAGLHALRTPRLTGVYVHLPFCDIKCAYCDFYSLANRHVGEGFWHGYTDRLVADLDEQYRLLGEDTAEPCLASIFFGGGTPSRAPAFVIERLIAAIFAKFQRRLPHPEISAEANPESLSPDLLSAWRRTGVNRLSVGLQSLEERTLKYLGRLYNPNAYRRVLGDIRAAGFENYNADFITGVPGQGSSILDIDFALGEGVTHLSLYQLTLEKGTLLRQRVESGALPGPDDDAQVGQMEAAAAHLAAKGFTRYEISNFSRPGRQCLHNLIYWTGRPYLGLGVAAHMFTGKRRFFHPRSLETYMASKLPAEDTAARPQDLLIHTLRLTRPFHPARVLSLYENGSRKEVRRVLDSAIAKGHLVADRQGLLAATPRGLNYTDSLLAELWQISSTGQAGVHPPRNH